MCGMMRDHDFLSCFWGSYRNFVAKISFHVSRLFFLKIDFTFTKFPGSNNFIVFGRVLDFRNHVTSFYRKILPPPLKKLVKQNVILLFFSFIKTFSINLRTFQFQQIDPSSYFACLMNFQLKNVKSFYGETC